MIGAGLSTAGGVIGPAGFVLLVWGAVLLAVLVLGYIVWTLLTE